MALKVVIEMIGFKSTSDALSLMFQNLSKDQRDELKPLLVTAQNKMINIINSWSFSGELIDSFVITDEKTLQGYDLALKNVALYAPVLEKGIDAHWVRKGTSTKLDDWVRKKGVKYSRARDGNLILGIGNKRGDTRVGFRQSRRRFFSPVIREMTNDGEFDKTIKSGLRNTLNNFERRSGIRDKQIFK